MKKVKLDDDPELLFSPNGTGVHILSRGSSIYMSKPSQVTTSYEDVLLSSTDCSFRLVLKLNIHD